MILVSADFGFNGVKVCAVDSAHMDCVFPPCNIPYDVAHLAKGQELGEMFSGFTKNSFGFRSGLQQDVHIFGGMAHSFNSDQSENATVVQNRDMDRFKGEDFRTYVVAVVGAVLRLMDASTQEVHLVLTLPHTQYRTYAEYLAPLKGEHTTGIWTHKDSTFTDITFSIAVLNVFSQTIASFIGYIADDTGAFTASMDHGLIIDAGYKTVGLARIEEQGLILPNFSESNEDFAMHNVNRKIREELLDENIELDEYDIEKACAPGRDGYWAGTDRSGAIVSRDISGLRSQAIAECSGSMMEYLRAHNYRLESLSYILVTGGTGKMYFPYINQAFEEGGTYGNLARKPRVILATCMLFGEQYESVFAITIGGLKYLLSKYQ